MVGDYKFANIKKESIAENSLRNQNEVENVISISPNLTMSSLL